MSQSLKDHDREIVNFTALRDPKWLTRIKPADKGFPDQPRDEVGRRLAPQCQRVVLSATERQTSLCRLIAGAHTLCLHGQSSSFGGLLNFFRLYQAQAPFYSLRDRLHGDITYTSYHDAKSIHTSPHNPELLLNFPSLSSILLLLHIQIIYVSKSIVPNVHFTQHSCRIQQWRQCRADQLNDA